jgi:pyoverdine/dityrosine biosynthesis protein Dit1
MRDSLTVVDNTQRASCNELSSTANDDRASLAELHAAEAHQRLLANHHLLDEIAGSDLDHVWILESRDDFSAGDQSQAFDAIEVGMLDRHDAGVSEQLFGVVVDQLTKRRKESFKESSKVVKL